MHFRRLLSPLLTLALLCGAVWAYRQSPWIREAQGWSPRPVADASAEQVTTLAPMFPPGYKAVRPTGGDNAPAFAETTPGTALVSENSTLQLAKPDVAEKVHLPPQRRTQIAQMVSSLNTHTEEVMRQAIAEWRKQGGVSQCHIPDFQSTTSPHRRKIAELTQKTEQQIARMLDEEELARWKALSASPTAASARLNMGLVQ